MRFSSKRLHFGVLLHYNGTAGHPCYLTLSYMQNLAFLLLERITMQSILSEKMEFIGDYILMRHPAVPRRWDPISRPHVAIVVDDPLSGLSVRYYLSQVGKMGQDGKECLDLVDIDEIAKEIPTGTLLEVKFSATNANLYRLEACGGVPCWRWIGKHRGIQDFDCTSAIEWEEMVTDTRVATANEAV